MMGVKTKIEVSDIRPFFDVESITPTKDGISDTVYILDDKYILKLYEKTTLKSLNEEIKIIDLCKDKDLPVSKVVKETFILKCKPAMIYEKGVGKSLEVVTTDSIKQIGNFLREFHNSTQNKTTSNPNLFEKSRVQKLIDESFNSEFQKIFDSINIELQNDGIIHGDLFVDNATFVDDKLSCVFDLNGACNGDFVFDLAVVALSWARDENDYKILLESYGLEIDKRVFKEYIKYAMLYYSITRYLDGGDYMSLLNRCKEI
jgi:homoserine kinase type II